MPLQKVALVGANGTLGPAILSALLSASFNVTVLNRQSSKSSYAGHAVAEIRLPDSLPTDSLIEALSGQDVLITTFAGTNADLQIRLGDACVAAGVRRFIPADFGSCDSESVRARALMPLYVGKKRVREHLMGLAKASEGMFSWSSVVCGHFFDFGLRSGLLSFDLPNRSAVVFDGGEIRWSASTLSRVGEAVVQVLHKEEQTRGKVLFVQSFCVSQNEVLAVLEGATGGKKWSVRQVKSEDYIAEMKGKLDADPNDGESREALVSVVGMVESNWEVREAKQGEEDGGFANELLGLKEESLHEVVKGVVQEVDLDEK